MATKIEAIKRTPAELISLDHYNSCNYCSDGDRGYCDEGERLARLCAEVGQVCPNCDAMSEDGGLCWYCHDEQKRHVEAAHAEALLQAERRRFACPVCGTSFRLTGGGTCARHSLRMVPEAK
jgi:transposase